HGGAAYAVDPARAADAGPARRAEGAAGAGGLSGHRPAPDDPAGGRHRAGGPDTELGPHRAARRGRGPVPRDRGRRRAPSGGLMAAAPGAGGGPKGTGWAPLALPLMLPTWAVIGIFLLLPVLLMAVYSFLTREFRGGVEWQFSLAAYDQFFVTRGLFGDEPASIEWTYILI